MAWSVSRENFPSRIGCCARCTEFSWPQAAARNRRRENFLARRIGSAVLDLETRPSYRRHPRKSTPAIRDHTSVPRWNGRIGRLLITLLFCHEGTLREPLLYCSLYFKQHRQEYYSQLNSVRETGDFERWIEFFATGIRVSAQQATLTECSRSFRKIETGCASSGGWRLHRCWCRKCCSRSRLRLSLR